MKDTSKPIWKSKRFWSSILGLIAMFAAVYFPEFQELPIEAILAIVALLVGGFTVEETAITTAQIKATGKPYPVASNSESKKVS